MDRKICVGIVVLVAAFTVSGCVSTGAYERMEGAKNEEIAALQKQRASLERESSALKRQNAGMQKQQAVLVAASKQRQQQYESLVQGLSKEVEKGQLQVRQYQDMLSVDLADQIFFDSGRARLKPVGKKVLKKVAEALKGYDNKVIRVVGHTDNVRLARNLREVYPTNWELSVARATNVVRFLQHLGIPPERMAPSGRSAYDPVASNETREGRQKNRRIEIMLIDRNLESQMARQGK